jgi:hypothetical protein
MGMRPLKGIVKRFTGLRHLDLRGTRKITANGVNKLIALKHLEFLRLSRSEVEKVEVATLSSAFGDKLLWDR